MYVPYLEKVGEHGWIIPAAAPLRNGHSAAAKCLNDAAQKEKKTAPIFPLNDRPLQFRSSAALQLIYTPSGATLLLRYGMYI